MASLQTGRPYLVGRSNVYSGPNRLLEVSGAMAARKPGVARRARCGWSGLCPDAAFASYAPVDPIHSGRAFGDGCRILVGANGVSRTGEHDMYAGYAHAGMEHS